jgi:ribosome-binding ATPase YchF (GTP1/OBG family)
VFFIVLVLEKGLPAGQVLLTEEEWPVFKQLNLLTAKPMMYLCNVSVCKEINAFVSFAKESDVLGNKFTEVVKQRAKQMTTASLIISARMEEEVFLLFVNSFK